VCRNCALRPNPKLFRETVFNFLAVQVGRKLTEDEVLQINLITKRRACRYIAAAEEDWLYPERTVSIDHWKKFGDGYLLMPEPRLMHMGGEIVIGYEGGGGQSFSPYGHTRGQAGFKDEKRERRETDALRKFKAEWVVKHGAKYTAYNNDFGGKLREDSAEMMANRKRVHEETRKQR
jgi:hypothetical protein